MNAIALPIEELRFADVSAPSTPQRQTEVAARLRAILPAHCVLFREEET